MLNTALFNFGAAAVIGSLFKVRVLLILIALIIIEFTAVVMAGGIGWQWMILNLLDVQAGYVAGVCLRGGLEYLGYSIPPARPRRLY